MAYHLRFDKGNLAMQAVVLFAVLFNCLPVFKAQEYKVVYKQIPDNRGTEFVVGFLQQFKQELDGATRLFITSDYNTRAVITSRHTNVRKEIQITSRELYPIDFPTSIRMQGTEPENKGIHIKADAEIVVYGLNIKKFTTDAYLALPVDIQSTKYIVPSFTPSYKSLIGIIAIYDLTTIFVTFRFADRKSVFMFRGRPYRHKDTLSITLSRHQTFQIAHSKDMTGTRIFSIKPISVLSGNECANVPTEKGYCDHLVEHIPPVNTWGQRFITAPLAGRQGGDFFRIMAANHSTDVRINGKHIRTLDEGRFIEVDVPSDRYQIIETSKPCIVLQYSKGQRVDNTFTDPFMVMIPPVEQYTAQYTVSTPDQNEKYFDSYINIIIDTKEIDGLRLDGQSLRDEKWVPIWGTSHSATRMAVSHGVHRVMHDSPIVPFAIFLYGYARADSYGYPGGLRLADLTLECVPGKPGDGLDNDCDRRIDEEIKNYIDDDNDGRIDEDLVTEPPEIILEIDTLILDGCPADVKKKLQKPKVISAPLCLSRGTDKLSFVDTTYERECVQYVERMWLVRDGCGNLANTTQEIRIRRPEMSVTFPDNVRGKCHLGEDLSEVGEPRVRMSCKEDQFSVKYSDSPELAECVRRGRTIAREWTVKASCGSVVRHTQKLLPDVTPPKVNFVGDPPSYVKTNFRISWNASEVSTFECSIDGPNEVFPCGSGLGATWSRRNIPDGKHHFWVRATDLAGNTGAYIRHPFQVDTTGPRLAFALPLKSLSQGPMEFRWRSNEVARFKCGLNPDRMEPCGSGTRGKDYRRDLQDGSYVFHVGAVDALGNEARIITHHFRIDSTPPRIKFGKSSHPTQFNTRVNLPLLSNEFANFNCSLDDRPYTPCGAGLTGRFVANRLTEGPHELKVKATDKAGNEAKPISLKWNSDRTSPNILFTPGLPTKFRERARVTWTSTEYARFECSLNDKTQFRSCGRGLTGHWTKHRVPEGDHNLYVRGTDRNGNVGPIAGFAFTIDNTYPDVSLNEPLPTTSTSETATFRWTSNEMAYYKCAVDDTDAFVDCGSGTTGDWTTPTLTNGAHTFYLTAKDEVGNNAPRLSHSWTIDNTPPVLEFRGNLPDNVNSNTQTFSWTSSEYANFKCYIDSDSQPFSCGDKGSWTLSELIDGQHTFRVFGTDRYGNQGPAIQHTWNIDTKAPKVDLAKVPETINKPKATFNWKANEPATFVCAVDDAEGTSCGRGTDGEYLTPTLADGEHEFRLLVEDMVGNLAPLIRSKFNIDTSLPVITFDKPDPTTPQTGLSVTWQSSEEAEFECSLDTQDQYEPCGRGTTGSFQDNDLPDGRHVLYVRGTDDIGNVGSPSAHTVTIDRTPPTVRFTRQPNPLSKNPIERFAWSSDEPATFLCKVDEREETECGEGTGGEFTAQNLPDGDHVFQVTPVDDAGNRGRTLERLWNKDTTAPEIRYTSQPPKVSRDTVLFKWTSEEATFECALDLKSAATPCGRGTTGQKRLFNLPIGTRVFYVRGTDNAGNVGQFVPHSWSVDTNPPDIEFTGDLPSFSKKQMKFTWRANEDSQFECRLDNSPNYYPCGNGLAGNTTLSNLPEGNHTFYVRARDSLDNVDDPISHSWVVDSIPPRAVLDPVSPIVGTPRVTLYWRANEKSKFLCAIGDVGNVIECGEGTTGSWTTPYLRRGPQRFWLIAEDYTGNRAKPVNVTWSVDNKAPEVTFSKDSTSKSTTSSPRFSWTSDEAAEFECAIQGVSTFVNCGSGTSGTWTGTNVPDGKRRFLVRARDRYGNQNEPSTFPFEIDTTPPSGFVTSAPPKRTSNPRATFRWRTSEDAKYKCYLNNEISPIDCGRGRNGEFTTDSLPDNKHEFSVVATDELGNSAPVVNATWTVDTSGPVLTFAPNLATQSLGSPWFNWTSDETAVRFLCALDDQSNWEFCGSGKTGVWQKYNVPDGKHRLFVQGTDDLGNTGPTIRHTFGVDNTPPRISITTPPDPSSSTPTIEWSSTEPVDFKCFLDGREVECGEGVTGSWTGYNVPDGRRKFVIEGVDNLGNTGRFTYHWTKDSTVPSVTFDSNQPTVTLSTPRFTWTSSEPANFECSLDRFRTLEPCGSGITGSWQRYKLDGDYVLSVRGRDNSGNTGAPARHSFRVDNTAPTVVIESTTDLQTATPTIQWTSSEDVNFKCSLDGGRYFYCGNGTTGSWTGTNLIDGRHKFVIEGEDPVRNTGTLTFTWNKDSTLPEVTFDANQPTVTLRFPRFSWTSNKRTNFECSLDGFVRSNRQCGSGTTGAWQTFQRDGNYTLSVRGRDNDGKTGPAVSHRFRVDNTPPTIKIVSKPRLNSSNPSIQWSSDEDVTFRCSLDYRDFFNCGRGTIGFWTGDNLPQGLHTFVIEGKDEMKNTGRHTYKWTQDSIAPQLQFKQLPDKADSTPSISWTSNEPAIFECSLDGADYEECGRGYDGQWQKRIPRGEHTFSVRGKDAYENVGQPIMHTWNIDARGPVLTITTTRITRNWAQFSWTSNKPARFFCSLDNKDSWQYCGSGTGGSRPYYSLTDGVHTFYVRGQDSRRNMGSPASHEFTVDNTPPVVTVTSDDSPYATRYPSFTFNSSKEATFMCAVDSTRFYQPCGRGRRGVFTASNVQDGRHAFFVQGKDLSGNFGPHARYLFTVDTTGPQAYFTSSTPRTTKSATVRLTWLASEHSLFSCTVDGKTASCGSGTEGNFTTDPLSDGRHTFTLDLVDRLGNKGKPVSVSWETDSSSPEIEFPPDLPRTTSTNLQVSWTSSEFAFFQCNLDGVQRISCGQGTTGDMSFRTSEGPHTFSVRGTDRYGNTGEWRQYRFDVDATGPVITFPSSTPTVTSSQPTFTWDSSENAKFKCGIDNSFTLVDCGRGSNGRWILSNVADGPHVFIVVGKDDYGNSGPYAQHRFTVDNTVPVITFLTSNVPTNNKPQIRWTSSEHARFQCSLNGQNYQDCGNGFSGVWTENNVPHGRHNLSVIGRDKNGNVGKPATFEWSVDVEPPVLSWTSTTPKQTNNPSQRITWDSNEPATFECTLDGRKFNCGRGTNGVYTTPNLPDGNHIFTVVPVDDLRNRGIPKVVTWSTDTQPPVLTWTSNTPTQTNNPSQRITWDSSEPATFECTLDGLKVECGRGTDGEYITPNLPDGDHTFTVTPTDYLRNKGRPQVVTWSTDTQPPVLTWTSNTPTQTNNPSQRITWDSSEPATFECTLDGLRVNCGRGRNGVYITPNLPDGNHTFTVIPVDDLRNRGRPQVVTWSTDTQPPVLTWTSNTPTQTNNRSQRITWDSSEPATFECTLDGRKFNCGRGEDGEYTTPNLPNGDHTFTVIPTDYLRNKGRPQVVTWSTDAQAPVLTLTSNTPTQTNNPSQRITWDSSETATFKCTLNGRKFNCGRGTDGEYTTPNLPDGNHTFTVIPVDDLRNKGRSKVVTWSTDTQPPVLTLTSTTPTQTNNPSQRITWDSSEPATFECTLDGLRVNCGRGTVGEYITPNLPDGDHTFTVIAVDGLGNRGRPQVVTWSTDSTVPSITFSPTLPFRTRASPLVTWTTREFSTFECALDDKTRIISCGRGKSGDWNGLSIPHGPHTFWVRGTDLLGNVGEWEPYNFEVDSKGPNITFHEQPTDTQSSPTFRWSSSESAQFKCRMESSFNEVDCGNGMNSSWSGNQIPDGPHKLLVYGVDDMNNQGPMAEFQFNVDSTGPRIYFPRDLPVVTKTNPLFTWTSSEPANFKCAIEGSQLNYVDCGEGTSGNWSGLNIPDGEYKFLVYGTDKMNNRGPTEEHTFTVDATGPKISFDSEQPTRTKNYPSFTWTSSEFANFKCALDGGQREFVDCSSGTIGRWTGFDVPDGPSKLLVYGVDRKNNRGPIAEYQFVVDTRPPQITFSGDLPDTTGRNPTLTWSSSEYASFECKLEDGVIFECGRGDDGSWTGTNLSDGPHSLSIRGTDTLGNQGQFISRSWTVDESGPRLRFEGEYPARARRLPRIHWISNEYAFFECSLNGRNYTKCGQGERGSWWKDEIPTGLQELRVRGRDTKGNVGDPILMTIDIDTTAPNIKLIRPLPVKTDQPTWEFTWTSDEIANFTCAVDSLSTEEDCGFGLNGRYPTKPLSDAVHTFYLFGEDELGNAARVIIHRWRVNKEKPEIEFLPNQPTLSDADITLLWKTTSQKSAQFECALDDVSDMRPCGEGTTGSWTGTDIPNGDRILYVRAKDSFGAYGQIKTHSWKVDTKVPQVNLIGTPPEWSNYDTGSFHWTSDENATYECAIDLAESGTPCGSGTNRRWMSTRLDDGEHTFYLFATDLNGNQAPPIEYKWNIDTTPPIVTLDENTGRVSGNNVTLRWRTNEFAIFQCAVDSIFDNRDCGSGTDSEIALTDLYDGPHTIWIKAVDALGNDAPWKQHDWNVDSKPPELEFTSDLPTKTNTDVTFFWRSKETAGFKCGTNPDDLKDCGVGQVGNWSSKNLTNGVHEFFVEATDEFGNQIRILHRWTVDSTPPVLYWRRRVPDVTGKRVRFKWLSDETAEFFCAHENIEDMVKCGNFSTRGRWIEEDLPEGRHRFWVVGVDAVGNRGIPLYHTWIVDTKGPTLFFDQPVPKKSGRTVRFSWRSNEYAKFKCTFDDRSNFTDCGEGTEARLSTDNLKRNGEHILYVKGIDRHGNVGETIATKWIVDLVAPVLVESGLLPRLTNKNPLITWTVNEEAIFECALDNLDKFEGCGNGTKSEWRGKDLDKGPHTILIRGKDPQGNTNNLINHTFVVGIPDNRGREFMLGFMQQYLHKRAGSVSLFITSDNNTMANITIPGGYVKRLQLQADELVRVDLPISVRMSGSQKEKKGILVVAEHELVVYGLNIMPHSTDAFLALPTDIQGTEYYAVSYTVSQHSLIAIVGIYDGTVLYITLRMSHDTPLVYNGAVYRDGETMILTINRQETIQLAHDQDLTGTRIASTQVISVYSGNECANVPKENGYCDHLVEMLTPTSTWGRRFVTAPLFSRKAGDFFRVVASQDNTVVTFHPNDWNLLSAGQYMERDIPSDEYKFITATKPCLLMQYSKGADSDNTNTDPFLIMIPPIEQYGSHYILSTPDRPEQQYFQSYINVIVLSDHYQGVLVDGNPAYRYSVFKKIPGTPYSASAVRVTKGVHRVDHTSPIVTFGAFMYGFAWRDSYGYPGGLRLADITGECTGRIDTPADGMDNDCDRRIDEELKNGIDDDGDGLIDEDLATFPPTIEIDTPYYEYESCVFEVDALVPRPKAISSADCNYKGALRLTYRDKIVQDDCTQTINRTWQASDGCGNVVYLSQIIKITRPKLFVRFPRHVPNGCVGAISLRVTGRPEVESPCKQERVRVAYRDNISKKDCQEAGLLLERHFTVTEVCGREYTGVQRIYPGARS